MVAWRERARQRADYPGPARRVASRTTSRLLSVSTTASRPNGAPPGANPFLPPPAACSAAAPARDLMLGAASREPEALARDYLMPLGIPGGNAPQPDRT